ncbi:phage head closure protein [Paenibacillus apiarius]|uniref:phage head closure protein n=1 Tax=Paenibacillus apiarius TaxID=46240 RepID=UPI003B3BD9DE
MAKKLTTSELNRRITIQQKTVLTDQEGILQEKWVPVCTIWAKREPIRGREYFEAAATNAEKTVRYKVRYRLGILPEMRIIDGKKKVNDEEIDRVYHIVAVLDDVHGDRTETHLMTEEGPENG